MRGPRCPVVKTPSESVSSDVGCRGLDSDAAVAHLRRGRIMTAPINVAKYIIQKPIRQGGMGAVFLAYDAELERPVAVKLLRDDVDNEESRERFVREARAVAGLRHP